MFTALLLGPELTKETVTGRGCKDRHAAIFWSLAMYITTRGSFGLAPTSFRDPVELQTSYDNKLSHFPARLTGAPCALKHKSEKEKGRCFILGLSVFLFLNTPARK